MAAASTISSLAIIVRLAAYLCFIAVVALVLRILLRFKEILAKSAERARATEISSIRYPRARTSSMRAAKKGQGSVASSQGIFQEAAAEWIESRAADVVYLFCYLALGIFFLGLAQAFPGDASSVKVTCGSCGGTTPFVVPTPSAPLTDLAWPSVLLVAVLAVCAFVGGVVLLASGRKAAGAASLAIGTLAAGGFAIVKEMKFENFIGKVEVPIIEERLKEASPRYLGTIECFATGSPFIPDNPKAEGQSTTEEHCVRDANAISYVDSGNRHWSNPQGLITGICGNENGNSLILVVGATDRVPLRRGLLKQYDANVGLAQGRAVQVAERLQKCLNGQNRVLALVSGPVHTQEGSGAVAGSEDRKVDLWAIGSRGKAEVGDQGHGWRSWGPKLWLCLWLASLILAVAGLAKFSEASTKKPE